MTPQTLAQQAPQAMELSRQEYWSGCHAFLQGIFLTQGSNPHFLYLLHYRQILYCWATREAHDIPYTGNLKDLIEVNVFTRKKQTHRLREETYGCPKEGCGEGIVKEFGIYMYTWLYLKWIINRTYCVAKEILLNVMWHLGWEWGLEKNGHMYTYGWVALLFTWNYHNIVNWLYSNTK